MSNYRTIRICITVSEHLLQKLDHVAMATYVSRSDAIRLALVDWFGSHPRRAKAANLSYKPPAPPPKGVKELLSPEQLVVLKRYQDGEIGYDEFSAAIDHELWLKLLDIGEL